MTLLNNNVVLRFLIDKMQQGVALCDMSFNIVLWNESADRLIGSPPTPLNSTNWIADHKFYHIDGTELEEKDRALYRAIKEENETVARVIYKKDDKDVYIETTAYPLYDEDKQLIGGAAFFKEITNQIKMEATLNEILAKLEEMKKYLKSFSL